ncbi:hypothetical protein ACFS07_04595 [Undibacterium arcticum]
MVTTAAPHTDDPVPGVVSPTSDSIRVEARGAALAILVVIAFVFALQWAQKFFYPAGIRHRHRLHAQSGRGLAGKS